MLKYFKSAHRKNKQLGKAISFTKLDFKVIYKNSFHNDVGDPFSRDLYGMPTIIYVFFRKKSVKWCIRDETITIDSFVI